MAAARGVIAFVGLLQGWNAHAQPVSTVQVPGTLGVVYADEPDGGCSVGSYCSATVKIPQLRGLCVMTATSKECWDACNTAHTIQSYSATNTKAIAMMIKQLRTGNGPPGASCPGSKSRFANETKCNQGERCTPAGLTWGRGMCVSVGGVGDQCKDMCDTSIPLDVFHDQAGKQAGTMRIVQQVRAGRDPSGLTTCPGMTVWVWLWIPILLVCLLGCCFGTFQLWNFMRGNRKVNRSAHRDQADEQMQEPIYDQDPMYAQEAGMPPPQTMDQMPQDGMYQQGYEDPMPVVDQPTEPLLAEPVYEEKAADVNLFGGEPNLFPGLAPLTATAAPMMAVAAPTSAYPVQGFAAAPVTTAAYSQSFQPQQLVTTASRPPVAYTTGGAMTTQVPYGSYGAYGGTQYPATTSMRIG